MATATKKETSGMENNTGVPTTSSIPELSQETLSLKRSKEIAYRIVKDEKVQFTKEVAQRFIQMPTFEGERNLDSGHVDALVAHAKSGTFLYDLVTLMSCRCTYDGITRRLNGQHSCWMREYLSDAQNEIRIRHIQFEVDSDDAFRKLYCLVDSGKARTKSHKLAARLVGTEELGHFSSGILNKLTAGMEYLLGGGRRDAGRTDIFDTMLLDKVNEVRVVGDFLVEQQVQSQARHLWRGPVIGAMFASLAKNKTQFYEFWKGVVTGENLSNGDPRKTLRDWLMTSAIEHGRGSSMNMVRSVSREDVYTACVLAWNAFREQRPLTVLKTGAVKKPTVK